MLALMVKNLFQDKICKVIVAELEGERIVFLLYSYLCFVDFGRGIYCMRM